MVGLVPWGAPASASGGGNHFLPAPPGSPLEMELGECCTNRKHRWEEGRGAC